MGDGRRYSARAVSATAAASHARGRSAPGELALDRALPVPAVERRDLEPVEVHARETSDIHVDLVRVRSRDIERVDTTRATELVLGDLGIERVGRQGFLTRDQ